MCLFEFIREWSVLVIRRGVWGALWVIVVQYKCDWRLLGLE